MNVYGNNIVGPVGYINENNHTGLLERLIEIVYSAKPLEDYIGWVNTAVEILCPGLLL